MNPSFPSLFVVLVVLLVVLLVVEDLKEPEVFREVDVADDVREPRVASDEVLVLLEFLGDLGLGPGGGLAPAGFFDFG